MRERSEHRLIWQGKCLTFEVLPVGCCDLMDGVNGGVVSQEATEKRYAVSILAIVLTLIIELDIIDEFLLKINDGKALSFDAKFLILKKVVGLTLLALSTYLYIRWNVNQGYRDKKGELRHFIQTMQLARGLKKRI